MSEDLSLGVSVDGVDESVKALGAVATAQKSLEQATLKAAGSMSNENLAALRKSIAEYERLKTAAASAASTQATMGSAAATSAQRFQQLGPAISLAAGGVSRLSSSAGVMTGVLAQAASTVGSLSAAMGPVGIALAGVSFAVSAGTALYNAYVEEQERAIEASKKLSEELYGNANAFDTIAASRRRLREEASRAERLGRGEGTTEEFAILEQQRSQQMAVLRRSGLEGTAEFQRLNQERLAAQAQQRDEAVATRGARSRADATVENMRGRAARQSARGRGGGGGGGGEEPDLLEKERRRQVELARLREEALASETAAANAVAAKHADDAAREFEARRIHQDELTRLAKEGITARLLDEEEAARQRASAIDEQNASNLARVRNALAREVREREKAAKTMASIQSTVGDAHKALSAIIEATAGTSEAAQRKKLKAEAAITVVDSGINAAVEVARAAASYPDVAGIVSHGAAAVGFTVAAAKAAIVAGGGGGAAGSGTPSAAAQAGGGGSRGSRPNAFDAPQSESRERSGPSRTIVQVGIPLGTMADIGREVQRANRAAMRASGKRI